MAIQILKRILLPVPPCRRPFSLSLSSSSFSSSSSISSDQSQTLISTAVSILTHHRSKSRWNHLQSLNPAGFTPDQVSQIILLIRNNPRLALRFFDFTTHKSLCNHDLFSYSTIIHVLARARLKDQAQSVIRTAIRVAESESSDGEECQLSKPLKVFESLVKTYLRCGSAPFVFDLLINACLESKKIDGSIAIMRKLKSRGISPRVSTCNSLISSVCRCRGAEAGYAVYREVFNLDDEVEENGKRVLRVCPNVCTFNALMLCCYQDGAMEKVEEIWSEMVKLGCVADVYSYSILMAALCDEGRMGEAEKLWEEMRVKKLDPNVVAYNTLIGGFSKIGEIKRAEELFGEMGLSGIESTSTTYEHLINGYCKTGDVESAMLLYKDMCRKDFRPETSTIDLLITGLCDKRRVNEALEVLRFAVSDSGFTPSSESYKLLIKEICVEGKMEEALKLQAEMVGKGFEPSAVIYHAFINGYMKQGNEEVAGMLMKEMLKLNIRGKGINNG